MSSNQNIDAGGEEQLALGLELELVPLQAEANEAEAKSQPEQKSGGFKELRLKRKYSTYRHNLDLDFCQPVLAYAVQYDRSSGDFSSSSLAKIAQGLEVLQTNQGKMRLLMGHCFNEQDYREIIRFSRSRTTQSMQGLDSETAGHDTEGNSLNSVQAILAENLLGQLKEPENPIQEARLMTIGNLIKAQLLEIRIAMPISPDGFLNPRYNQFRERVGIAMDRWGNTLTFNGSNDESVAGWGGNLESFHVFCDWRKGDEERVRAEVKDFNDLWEQKLKRKVLVLELPDVVRTRLMEYSESCHFEETELREQPPTLDVRPHKLQTPADYQNFEEGSEAFVDRFADDFPDESSQEVVADSMTEVNYQPSVLPISSLRKRRNLTGLKAKMAHRKSASL